MIVSETFYQARCDAVGCERACPADDDEGASHYPMKSLLEELRSERGEFDETWAIVGEKTYCPQHVPGNIDCTHCGGVGHIRTAQYPPQWDRCRVCCGRGYLTPIVLDGPAKGDRFSGPPDRGL